MIHRPLLLVLVLLAVPCLARADVSLGGWMDYSPDDITGFTSLTGDDATVDVTIPFGFTRSRIRKPRVPMYASTICRASRPAMGCIS